MRTKVVVSLVCVACGYMSLFTACEPIEQMEQEETAQDVGPVCGQPAGDYFNVTLGTLEVSETFPTGADWDIDGSYADPFMEVFVWNTALEEVMFEYGTTEAGLNVTRVDLGADPLLGVYLEPEEVLVIAVYDEDQLYDDDVGQLMFTANDLAEAVNCGTLEYTDDAGIVSLELEVVDDLAR